MAATPPPVSPGPEKRPLRSISLRPLIYVLLALLVIAIAMGVAVPGLKPGRELRIHATRTSIKRGEQAQATFNADHGQFPTDAEGLDALVHRPPGMSTWHPYLDKLPLDAWKTLVYRSPSTTGQPDYDLYSIGPDGVDGTADDIWDTP